MTHSLYMQQHTQDVENFYQEMKQQGDYKFFRKGAFFAIRLTEEQIKLDMSLDGIQVNGWNILPLIEPMVNFLRIT